MHISLRGVARTVMRDDQISHLQVRRAPALGGSDVYAVWVDANL
jgi:hypothetical protein